MRITRLVWACAIILCFLLLSMPILAFADAEGMNTGLAEEPPLEDEEPDYASMQRELDEIRLAKEELMRKAKTQEVSREQLERNAQNLFADEIDLMMRAFRGTFLLDGKVVDEHGAPMNNVVLTVSKRREVGIDRHKTREDQRTIDGSFSVRVAGYTDVALIFTKPGYYQVRLRFPKLTDDELDDLDEEFERGRVIPRRYEHRNLRVEMQSIGELAQTIFLGYRPSFSTLSEGVFIELRSFKTIRLPGGGHFLPEQRMQLGVDEIPEAAIFIKPALDQAGRILPLDEDLRYSRFPSEVTLILNAEEGGFLLHEGGAPEKGFWFMEEAPEEGYQRELKIDGQFLYERLKTQGPFSGVFFYFKVGDTYGKARLQRVRIVERGNTLNASIEMFFQPDGTRFLRTGRGL